MTRSAFLLLFAALGAAQGAWWGSDEGEPIQGIPASFNADRTVRHNAGTLALFETRQPNLVVALVADESWTPAALGWNASQANWDLLAIYTGSTPGWSCGPACMHTVRLPGLKWGLVWQLTRSNFWQDLQARYQFVMFPDGDLQMGTCAISAVFDTMAAFGLLMAQPSICEGDGSYTRQGATYQRPDTMLRFTNYVSLHSPAFDMQFFDQHVRPGLEAAGTGLGLDWCWPHRLGYPKDRIAMVDSVCARHLVPKARLQEAGGKNRKGKQPMDCSKAAADKRCKGGLYATALELTGRTAAEEQAGHWAACGYNQAAAEAAGQTYLRPQTAGSVRDDSRRPAAVALKARLAACRQGLPRGLAQARASFLATQRQQEAAAQGSWGYAPLLLAAVMLAPVAVGSGMWLWRRCCRALRQHRRLPF